MSTERTRRGPARGMIGRPGGGHGPGGPGMMPGEKAKDFKGTFKKLLHYLGSYKMGRSGGIALCRSFHRAVHLRS